MLLTLLATPTAKHRTHPGLSRKQIFTFILNTNIKFQDSAFINIRLCNNSN